MCFFSLVNGIERQQEGKAELWKVLKGKLLESTIRCSVLSAKERGKSSSRREHCPAIHSRKVGIQPTQRRKVGGTRPIVTICDQLWAKLRRKSSKQWIVLRRICAEIKKTGIHGPWIQETRVCSEDRHMLLHLIIYLFVQCCCAMCIAIVVLQLLRQYCCICIYWFFCCYDER